MKEKDKLIETLEQIVTAQDEKIVILEQMVELFKKKLLFQETVFKTLNADKNKYPKWLWNAIYFLAGIGFWQTLLWLL
jgi:hypothetical protein